MILAALLLALLFSVYYSAMETVYTTFDRVLVTTWLRRRRRGARTAQFLSERPERFLTTTLIGNNAANVAYSTLLVMLAERAGLAPVWLVTVSPLFMLVFAELLPKMIGWGTSNLAVRWFSFPLLLSYFLFLPLRVLLLPLTRLTARTGQQNGTPENPDPAALRAALDQILVGARAEGTVTPEEGAVLERYLDARELKVRQIMTPRTQMVAVSSALSPDEVREVFRKFRYNVLPVYEGDLDHVIGCVYARDFLVPRESVAEVLRPLHAVPESKRIVDLLQEFKRGRRQAALVVDEYGGTDGFVTIKDIFEELVGPVAERWDPSEPVIKRIASGKFLISGSAFLDDIEEQTGVPLPETESVTLSGFLSEKLGRIPEAGEEFVFNGIVIRVLLRNPRRVDGCLVKVPRAFEEKAS